MCYLSRRGVPVTYIPASHWLAAVDLPAAVSAYKRGKALRLLRWRSNQLRLSDVEEHELLVHALPSATARRRMQQEQQHHPPHMQEPEPLQQETELSQETSLSRHRVFSRPYSSPDWAGDPTALLLRVMQNAYLSNKRRATKDS
jgi:hypothetical protein